MWVLKKDSGKRKEAKEKIMEGQLEEKEKCEQN